MTLGGVDLFTIGGVPVNDLADAMRVLKRFAPADHRWWLTVQDLVRLGAPIEPFAGQGMTVWRAVELGVEDQILTEVRGIYAR